MTNPMSVKRGEAHEVRVKMIQLESQITFDHVRIRALQNRPDQCESLNELQMLARTKNQRFEREQFDLAKAKNDAAEKDGQDEENYRKYMENTLA